MTVKELIELLKEHDPEANVRIAVKDSFVCKREIEHVVDTIDKHHKEECILSVGDFVELLDEDELRSIEWIKPISQW